MSRNAQPYILNSISQNNVGPNSAEVSPKEVDLHPGHSPAGVAQSGQRATQVTSPGEVLSASTGSGTGKDPASKFLKSGQKTVELDTVKTETRAMITQFAASQKTGIPLPGELSVQPEKVDHSVLLTQATAPAATSSAAASSPAAGANPAQTTAPKPAADPNSLPMPLEIVKPETNAAQETGQPGGMVVEDTTTKLLEILNPKIQDLDIQLAAGLPRQSKVYVLTPDHALTLALVNSRDYQSRLENIYLTALPVTLQRFNLEPQVFAGLSPTTGTFAGGSPANFANSFLYRTLEAPGGQASVLSQGQVAGVGKVFMSGARVVAAFASQTVFNLTGSNPIQPSVQSVIPISIVQPFLKGGGRAVTLEGLTQAERNLLYEVRAFARYRQDFVAKTMLGQASGGSANLAIGAGGSTGVGGDPTVGFMPLLQTLMQIENNRNAVSSFETSLALQEEQLGGEGSSLTQLQVDQTNSDLQNSRVTLLVSQVQFRNQLDQFKVQMGLPPDLPIMPDLELISPYRKFLRELREWSIRKDRELAELDVIVGRLPDLDELDIKIDDRSVLDVIIKEKFDDEEELLNSAVRVAMENRLDLMNARAQLYDSWRQIRVTANALKGVFNVGVTNQVFTSPTTTNPMGFLSDAKQFNLVLNAELPLVRLNERNQFRQALINYQSQRRNLMRSEDTLKQSIRSEIRALQLTYQQYEIGKRQFTLSFRQRDQSQEQLFSPGGSTDQALQVINLNQGINRINSSSNQLASLYVTFLGQRLQLYRDLGIMPYDEWEAFYELFAPKSIYSVRWDGANDPAGEPAAAGLPVQ
jgi:Outer membrane efflux protein